MSKILQLYNTFTRKLDHVSLNGKLVSSIGGHVGDDQPTANRHQSLSGSLYICGPTVYSESHLGHALTYTRVDLFRRFMKNYFNVHLTTVMNITDIDDKILQKCREHHGEHVTYSVDPMRHPFRTISDKYFKSFLDDMKDIRVQPADVYVKISENINIIMNYIRKLEENGQAYIAANGDVNFKVTSVKNYEGRVDKRVSSTVETEVIKADQRDFVLWKRAKELEPVWNYMSSSGDTCIPGRPGWHVQCAAISSSFFGSKLDFHYGGKDLIFPHHYNEEACSCAYHNLDTSSSMHVWCDNWLHSSHLTIRQKDEEIKMSKSIGNVVSIKDFIEKSSTNALRLLCILSHYRTDLVYSDELVEKVKSLDHRLSALHNFLADKIGQLKANPEDMVVGPSSISCIDDSSSPNADFGNLLIATENDIVDGICDDMDLWKGLDSILALTKYLYSSSKVDELSSKDLFTCWFMLRDWCRTCGLDYFGQQENYLLEDTIRNPVYDLLRNFRFQVRSMALDEIKSTKSVNLASEPKSPNATLSQKLLQECDNLRSQLDKLGFVERDPSSKEVVNKKR